MVVSGQISLERGSLEREFQKVRRVFRKRSLKKFFLMVKMDMAAEEGEI